MAISLPSMYLMKRALEDETDAKRSAAFDEAGKTLSGIPDRLAAMQDALQKEQDKKDELALKKENVRADNTRADAQLLQNKNFHDDLVIKDKAAQQQRTDKLAEDKRVADLAQSEKTRRDQMENIAGIAKGVSKASDTQDAMDAAPKMLNPSDLKKVLEPTSADVVRAATAPTYDRATGEVVGGGDPSFKDADPAALAAGAQKGITAQNEIDQANADKQAELGLKADAEARKASKGPGGPKPGREYAPADAAIAHARNLGAPIKDKQDLDKDRDTLAKAAALDDSFAPIEAEMAKNPDLVKAIIGPFDGLKTRLEQKFGVNSAEGARLYTLFNDAMLSYRHAMTGAAGSAREFAQLQAVAPGLEQNFEQIIGVLAARKGITAAIKDRIEQEQAISQAATTAIGRWGQGDHANGFDPDSPREAYDKFKPKKAAAPSAANKADPNDIAKADAMFGKGG